MKPFFMRVDFTYRKSIFEGPLYRKLMTEEDEPIVSTHPGMSGVGPGSAFGNFDQTSVVSSLGLRAPETGPSISTNPGIYGLSSLSLTTAPSLMEADRGTIASSLAPETPRGYTIGTKSVYYDNHSFNSELQNCQNLRTNIVFKSLNNLI